MRDAENEDMKIPSADEIDRFERTMPQEQRWENLGISNDFMFFKIMQDTELALTLLQLLLPELEIVRIALLETQKVIDEFADSRGVRFDLYVRTDEHTVYNVEMQAANTKDLPQRARYNRSISDVSELGKGIKSYDNLSNIFVIFICTFDIFGAGRCVYTFRNLCVEDPNVEMNDGSSTIFINASAADTAPDISEELRAFLRFVTGQRSDDPYVKKLEAALDYARHDAKWRREYMNLRIQYNKFYNDGIAVGKAEGISIGKAEGIITTGRKFHISDADILAQLMESVKCSLPEAQQMLLDYA